jgi:hypothetical protein
MIANLVTDKDFDLLLELLESERNNLRTEMHHTDAMKLKEELGERYRMIERLIERFRSLQAEQRSIME